MPSPMHISVLLDEVVHGLAPAPGQILVDGTLGGGGHTRVLAQHVGEQGKIIALDRDLDAIERAAEIAEQLPVVLIHEDFRNLRQVLDELEIEAVDGVLLDLGLSSDQLADSERGFSFNADGPLDLRMNPLKGEPAWRLVERMSAEHLANLIYEFGEERHSRRIARKIVEVRRQTPIRTSAQLAELVRRCVPAGRRRNFDTATRTFQALRIAVNEEMKALEVALQWLPSCVRPGGHVAIISFHSLEDRQVKNAFRDDNRYEVLTKKPIRPQTEEVERNPRSRSARLRVARRTEASGDGSSTHGRDSRTSR